MFATETTGKLAPVICVDLGVVLRPRNGNVRETVVDQQFAFLGVDVDPRTRYGRQTNCAAAGLLALIRNLRTSLFSGDPKQDWLTVRNRFRGVGKGVWPEIAEYAEQLVAFQRGQKIASELTRLWQSQGTYAGAREALDAALAQEQLFAGGDDLRGIHVMTVHKSKAKEFDAVIIFDDPRSSPLVYCKESAPFPRSRRLLRVGVTRAKHQALILSDVADPSPLLAGHHL